ILERTSLRARRPSARGCRAGAGLLGGGHAPVTFLSVLARSSQWKRAVIYQSRHVDYFPAGACAKRLQGGPIRLFAQEAHGAIGKGEVRSARMTAAVGADAIEDLSFAAAGRHPVIDR